jgi:hypothetical protein
MKTAVEFIVEELEKSIQSSNQIAIGLILEKAKEIEKEQKIQAQIEILYSIGNNGANAPLYGILKTTLLDLQEQLKQQEK